MKVVVPPQDFHYATMAAAAACASYDSAPSSPKSLIHGDAFGLCCRCTSAPTSPNRAAAIYDHFCSTDDGYLHPPPAASSRVPFHWEEKPGTPKSHLVDGDGGDKLRFAFGRRREEVEFAGDENDVVVGEARRIILPLKPPPRLQYPAMDDAGSAASSPRLPRPRGLWPSGHQVKGGGGGGREGNGGELDPFTIAMMKATTDKLSTSSSFVGSHQRGRCVGSKWRLREMLFFRSASREPLSKYDLLSSRQSPSSEAKVDALEAAAAEGMKKKSALRRRQGLMSCIRFGSGGHFGGYSGQGRRDGIN